MQVTCQHRHPAWFDPYMRAHATKPAISLFAGASPERAEVARIIDSSAHFLRSPYMNLPTLKGTKNPKGIPSQSPGLRGTSYPGKSSRGFTTLKGLRPPVMRTTEVLDRLQTAWQVS